MTEPMSDQRRQQIEAATDVRRRVGGPLGRAARDTADLLAEVDRLRSLNQPPMDALRFLVDISTDERSHTYADGLCPDGAPYPGEEGRSHDRRDPECPACAATDDVIAWLALFSQPPTGCTSACSEMHTFESPCEAAVATVAADPEPDRPQWVRLTDGRRGWGAGSVVPVSSWSTTGRPFINYPDGDECGLPLPADAWVPADPPAAPDPLVPEPAPTTDLDEAQRRATASFMDRVAAAHASSPTVADPVVPEPPGSWIYRVAPGVYVQDVTATDPDHRIVTLARTDRLLSDLGPGLLPTTAAGSPTVIVPSDDEVAVMLPRAVAEKYAADFHDGDTTDLRFTAYDAVRDACRAALGGTR